MRTPSCRTPSLTSLPFAPRRRGRWGTNRPVPSLLPLCAALSLATAACGDDGTGPGGDQGAGTGTVQVTGSVNLSFEGPAVAGTDALTGLATFSVSVSDATATNNTDVVFTEGRPAPGTYAIGDPDSEVYGELGVASGFYESISGEVTISSSSNQSVAGSMTFTARRLGGQEQVSVTASFNAVCTAIPGLIHCD